MTIITREDKGEALTHAEMDENITDLRDTPDGKVFTKVQNKGILIDIDDPDFGWHDLTGVLREDGGVNSATLQLYRGGIKAWEFDLQDELFIDFHIPHDYAIGTVIHIHAHWSHTSTHVTSGSVTWAFEMMYAKRDGEQPFPVPVTPSVVSPVNIIQYSHLVHETVASVDGGSGVAVDTNQLEVDGIMQVRVYLDSNDITTDNASIVKPFLHFVDLHYQSTGIPTKQKEPDFWT